jgi:radical SAM protein with 4Fe4S-binding SPASM domain
MKFERHHRLQKELYMPRGLLLQWHITERCNLRCTHCYQDAYSGKELGLRDLLRILEQFKDFLQFWRSEQSQPQMRGHITITGGEPFVRRGFLDLLEVFAANRQHFSFAILTNGSFIDTAMARRLRKLGPSFVQVSIEGNSTTHDKIRGSGNLEQTVSALKHLVRERIRTFISFTAHQDNFREFTEVARLGRRLQVSRVWSDRLIPWGIGSGLKEKVLTPEDTQEFFEIMKKARNHVSRRWFGRTEIAMHRALQFLVAGGRPYHCTAGDTLVTVQPNGDLYPCRRMPIPVGNLLETPLIELYFNSNLFHALRNRNLISEKCQDCFYSKLCRGGLKCLSYAMTGDPFKTDPGCWQASINLRSDSLALKTHNI